MYVCEIMKKGDKYKLYCNHFTQSTITSPVAPSASRSESKEAVVGWEHKAKAFSFQII